MSTAGGAGKTVNHFIWIEIACSDNCSVRLRIHSTVVLSILPKLQKH